jgi:bifunctional non-homologous end joining protein LigD
LEDFAAQYRGKKIPAEIRQKWNERVLPAGLQQHGEAGAEAYLGRYGKGIAAPKVIHLALQAEAEDAREMARGFWRKAYELETGQRLAAPAAGGALPSTQASGPTAAPRVMLPEFPNDLQPGYVVTMQAVNAQVVNGRLVNKSVTAMPTPKEIAQARALLIADDAYWAQPKRDGERRVVWGGQARNAYQARSNNVRAAPSPEIDQALQAAAKRFGPLALDGEVWYPDVKGGEHRTAAQAYEANVKLGKPEAPTPARYAVFAALHAAGRDLRAASHQERVAAGERIGQWLAEAYPGVVEMLPTARTPAEKAALCARQKAEGREGEVFTRHAAAYTGGKQAGGDILRTKYPQEVDVVVLGVTPTTAAGRAFGALRVGVYRADGTVHELGEIGTGFNETEQAEIARRVAAGEKMVVTVQTHGRTEKGRMWNASFKDIHPDKKPEECIEGGE